MTEELLEQIKAVAGDRQEAQRLIELKRASYAEWEAQNAYLLKQIEEHSQVLTERESLLRELTIKAYQETGSKTPAPGVGIREITKLEYDPKEALKWALHHEIALSLDKKSFESFAKATPLDFVEIHTEPQATIATDLSSIIKED